MSARPSIWFVTPAWLRYKISRIVAEQRAWAIDRLQELGIDAAAVVIADDENLDIAREFGFATVEQNNDYLGAKFNDGYEYAAEHGVDYVCPIGSDSWLDPTFIAENLPALGTRTVLYSQHYAVVRPDGLERAQLLVRYEGGTTMMYPTSVFAHCGYRPIPDHAARGCDGHTIKAIKAGGKTRFVIREKHTLETVSFQSELQVTNYDALIQRWGVGQTDRPFAGLRLHYPPELVANVEAFYQERRG